MKISLSRKGFDATYGGWPSPILPDGTLLSLPIPEPVGPGIEYRDLEAPNARSYAEVMIELGVEVPNEGAHLDPDLDSRVQPRIAGWKPLFGQAGGPQTHLDDQGFTHGDVFLFYGWFRHTEMRSGRLRWRTPIRELHVIWGLLVADERWDRQALRTAPAWSHGHPHVRDPERYGRTNVVWVADPTAQRSFDPAIPNASVLTFDESLVLTAPGERRRSVWSLPDCFWPSDTRPALSGHSGSAWSRGDGCVIVRTKSPGQEYVIEATAAIRTWAVRTLRKGLP